MRLSASFGYILLIFSLCANNTLSISQQDPDSNIEVLTDKSFDIRIKKGKFNPWLILFTVPKCSLCNQTLDVFTNFTRYYNNEDNDLKRFNLSFAKLDCFQSSWTAMRFNILAIPQIMLIANNTYHLLKNNVTESILEDFIKSPGAATTIPPAFTYSVIFSKFFELFTQFLEKFWSNKGINWNRSYTGVLIVFGIVSFCIFEYYFINYCCRRKKNAVHPHSN